MCLDCPAIITFKVTMSRCLSISLVTSVEQNFRRSFTWVLITNICFEGVISVLIESEIVFHVFRPVHKRVSNFDLIERLRVWRGYPVRMCIPCIKKESYSLSHVHIRWHNINQDRCSSWTVSNMAVPFSRATIWNTILVVCDWHVVVQRLFLTIWQEIAVELVSINFHELHYRGQAIWKLSSTCIRFERVVGYKTFELKSNLLVSLGAGIVVPSIQIGSIEIEF